MTMLAVREEVQMSFFQYHDKESVRSWVMEEYEDIMTTDDEDGGFLSVSSVMGRLVYLYVEELFRRQVELGDIDFFPSQEECLYALGDDEKMNAIMDEALDVHSYNGGFSYENYYSDLEKDFQRDVIAILDSYGVSYLATHEAESLSSSYTNNYGQSLNLFHSPVQEVW